MTEITEDELNQVVDAMRWAAGVKEGEYNNYEDEARFLQLKEKLEQSIPQILEGLKALEELPKLKEKAKEWDLMDKVSKSFGIVIIFQFGMEIDRMGQENQKLKERIKELEKNV